MPSTPTGADSPHGTSGWSASWGGSGSTLECTITNSTGNNYLYTNYTGTQSLPLVIVYTDSGSSIRYTSSDAGWGSNFLTEKYGQNLYSQLSVPITNAVGGSGGTTHFYAYHSATTNRATVITELLELINTAGGSSASTTYPGVNPGSSTGTLWYSYKARESATGTIRISYNSIGGGFTGTYLNADATWGTNVGIGATDYLPTITNSTATRGDAPYNTNNADIGSNRQNVELSSYYGGRNLGVTGG